MAIIVSAGFQDILMQLAAPQKKKIPSLTYFTYFTYFTYLFTISWLRGIPTKRMIAMSNEFLSAIYFSFFWRGGGREGKEGREFDFAPSECNEIKWVKF